MRRAGRRAIAAFRWRLFKKVIRSSSLTRSAETRRYPPQLQGAHQRPRSGSAGGFSYPRGRPPTIRGPGSSSGKGSYCSARFCWVLAEPGCNQAGGDTPAHPIVDRQTPEANTTVITAFRRPRNSVSNLTMLAVMWLFLGRVVSGRVLGWRSDGVYASRPAGRRPIRPVRRILARCPPQSGSTRLGRPL